MVSQQTFGPVPGAPLLLGQSRGRPARAPWAGRQGAAPSRIQWGQMAGTGQHRSPTVLCLCAQPHAHTHRHEHESHTHVPCVMRPISTHTYTRPCRTHRTRPPQLQEARLSPGISLTLASNPTHLDPPPEAAGSILQDESHEVRPTL